MINDWALALTDGVSAMPWLIFVYMLIALPLAVYLIRKILRARTDVHGLMLSAFVLALFVAVVPIGFGGGGVTVIPLWLYASWGVPFLPFAFAMLLMWALVGSFLIWLARRIYATHQ